MKGKFLSLLMAVAITALVCAPIAKAAVRDVVLDGYTDKPYYKPGETVTVNYWIYNKGDEISPKKITIEYPWFSPIWGGNNTVHITGISLPKNGNKSYTETFTIPTDGRGHSGSVDLTLTYTFEGVNYTEPLSIYITVASVPWYGSFENMDKLVTMFTVQTVLIILAAIIIAAAIFLSRHKPVTWKEEHKSE